MATSPTSIPLPLRYRAGGLLIALLLAGCGKTPPPSASGSGTPASAATPAVTASATPGGELSYAEINTQYAAPVPEDQNGWPIIKPLLVPPAEGQPAPWDRYGDLAISDKPADLTTFDKEVLPTLKEGFSKPAFLESHQLLSGKDPLNLYYMQLRRLCEKATERADLYWEAGKKSEALDMLKLPLSLAKALQSRPETVSLNLFSSGYATYSLKHLADWSGDNSLKGPELSQAIAMLASFRPSYAHLKACLSVDFAQLDNSIKDETTRKEVLGLGLARPEDFNLWTDQLSQLKTDARKLYSFDATDPQVFNQAVLKMAPQVHGLVLEYPELTTMQKHGYATYLATELALTLEKMRLSNTKAPEFKALIETTFAGDPDAQEATAGLLSVVYKPGEVPKSFAINGRGKVFALASPDGNVSFYQR